MPERELLKLLLGAGRGWILATCALLAVTWLSAIALLALSGWFITATALSGAGLLAGLNIFTPSAGIRAAAVLRTLARYGERVVGHEAVLRILATLRTQTFARFAVLPLDAQRAVRSGDWQTRLSADIDTLDAIPLRVVAPVLAACVAVLAAIGVGAVLAPPEAAGLLLAAAVVVAVASLLAASRGRRYGRALVRQRAVERVAVLDHVGGLSELQAFRRADASRANLAELDTVQSQRVHRQALTEHAAEQAVQFLVALVALAMLLMALGWHRDGTLSGPVAVLLAVMTLGLNEALGSLPAACWRIGESLEAGRRLQAAAPAQPGALPEASSATSVHRESTPAPGAPSATLRLHGLVIGQARGRPLSCPLDLTVQRGFPLVVHGPSGIGKSTLLATLAGELQSLSGEAWLDEETLPELSAEARVRRLALLPQETVLIDGSVLDNLRLARPDLDEAQASVLLQGLGLGEYADGAEKGLEYAVGEGGRRLSGGQARRLALAWLILREPQLALVDEPFAGLDLDTEALVLKTLAPWLESRLAVIVSHAPERFPAHWPRLALARP